jgi:hypothetical protein
MHTPRVSTYICLWFHVYVQLHIVYRCFPMLVVTYIQLSKWYSRPQRLSFPCLALVPMNNFNAIAMLNSKSRVRIVLPARASPLVHSGSSPFGSFVPLALIASRQRFGRWSIKKRIELRIIGIARWFPVDRSPLRCSRFVQYAVRRV